MTTTNQERTMNDETMTPAELARRIKRGEKWQLAPEQRAVPEFSRPKTRAEAMALARIAITQLEAINAYLGAALALAAGWRAAQEAVSEVVGVTDNDWFAEQLASMGTVIPLKTQPAAVVQDPVAWRYWNEKSKSWNTTCSEVVAGVMRDSGRAVEPLYAAPPSQAVDLEQFREAVQYVSRTCPHQDLAQKLSELLALIDAQAERSNG